MRVDLLNPNTEFCLFKLPAVQVFSICVNDPKTNSDRPKLSKPLFLAISQSCNLFPIDKGHNQIMTKAHENFYVDRAKTLCLLQPPCQLAQSLPLLTQLLFTESAPLIRECPRFSFATSVPVPDQCTLRQKSLHPPIPIKCPKVTRRTELTWTCTPCRSGATAWPREPATFSGTAVTPNQASCPTLPKTSTSAKVGCRKECIIEHIIEILNVNQELQPSSTTTKTSESETDPRVAWDSAGILPFIFFNGKNAQQMCLPSLPVHSTGYPTSGSDRKPKVQHQVLCLHRPLCPTKVII